VVGFYTDEEGKVRPITGRSRRRFRVKLTRSAHALAVDRSLKAKTAKSPEQWYKQPNRYDLPGVDTPEDKAKGLNTSKANSKSEGNKMKEEQFEYTVGEDTGLIYPEEYREAVEALLKEGVKPTPLRRKYDPEEDRYFLKPDGTYEYVPAKSNEKPEAYALPKQLVEQKQRELQQTKEAEKQAKVKSEQGRLALAIEQARKTGKNVVLSSYVIPMENKDVIVYEVVTPEGEVKEVQQVEA
jgi:hypothetical protein